MVEFPQVSGVGRLNLTLKVFGFLSDGGRLLQRGSGVVHLLCRLSRLVVGLPDGIERSCTTHLEVSITESSACAAKSFSELFLTRVVRADGVLQAGFFGLVDQSQAVEEILKFV